MDVHVKYLTDPTEVTKNLTVGDGNDVPIQTSTNNPTDKSVHRPTMQTNVAFKIPAQSTYKNHGSSGYIRFFFNEPQPVRLLRNDTASHDDKVQELNKFLAEMAEP